LLRFGENANWGLSPVSLETSRSIETIVLNRDPTPIYSRRATKIHKVTRSVDRVRECAEPASPGRCIAPQWGETAARPFRGAFYNSR